MANKASSLSTVVSDDAESMLSSSRAVDKPEPDPNSRNRAERFDAARVCGNEQVSGPDAGNGDGFVEVRQVVHE